MCEVKNKVFLVTGAAIGIGAAVVQAVLKEGAKAVLALDVDVTNGKVLESELSAKYGSNKIKFMKCDVASNELDSAYDVAIQEFGYVDVVVNNAGIMNDSPNVYLKEIAVNVTALMASSLKAFNLMRIDRGGKGGTIVNISSIVGLIQSPAVPVYSATKSAVLQFSNCLGMEQNYAYSGVRVVTVCFGCTDTSLISPQKLSAFTNELETHLKMGIEKMPHQNVQSAVQGLLVAFKNGTSGSTWLVTSNRPAEEITENVKKAYGILSQGVFD